MRGTLLNTATVLAGSAVGLAVGRQLPDAYEHVALQGLGLVALGIGLRMFLQSKNVIVVAVAVAVGGCIGLALGLANGLDNVAHWAHNHFGASDSAARFNQGLITASIIFCVGPMTIVGCLQDGLSGDYDLLALKSTMDGIASIFLAATFGIGVLFTAAVVLIVQGALTLAARPLAPIARNESVLADISASGGTMMLAIGLGLLEIAKIPVVDYLPALAIAPGLGLLATKYVKPPSSVPA